MAKSPGLELMWPGVQILLQLFIYLLNPFLSAPEWH